MTVETEEVDIITKTSSNLFIELHPVEMASFFSASPVDVVDLQSSFVAESATDALAAKETQCHTSRWTLSSSTASSTELSNTITVLGSPLIHGGLLPQVHASSASAGLGLGMLSPTVNTGFRFRHDMNLARLEKMLDD
jgi:hypothetical protein